jgi:hypothetical protein
VLSFDEVRAWLQERVDHHVELTSGDEEVEVVLAGRLTDVASRDEAHPERAIQVDIGPGGGDDVSSFVIANERMNEAVPVQLPDGLGITGHHGLRLAMDDRVVEIFDGGPE